MQPFCFVCQKRRKPQQTETHPARKINDLWVAFSCYFPIGNKGGPQLTLSDIRERRDVQDGKNERKSSLRGNGRVGRSKEKKKKKRRSREQDQQMAALNTWDDSITDKSQEEVAGAGGWPCWSSQASKPGGTWWSTGPSFSDLSADPQDQHKRTSRSPMPTSREEKIQKTKYPQTNIGSAINLNCIIPSTHCPIAQPNREINDQDKKVEEEQVIILIL